jgi:hypothetical protein
MSSKIKMMMLTALILMPLALPAQNVEMTDTLEISAINAGYHTEYVDGKVAFIYSDSILSLAVTNTLVGDDYGTFYQLGITVVNNTNIPFDFDPSLIEADIIKKDGKKDSLIVYTADSFMKKIKRDQAWASVFTGLALGLESANASYTNTTSYAKSQNGYTYMTTSRTYNPSAASLAQIQSTSALMNMNENFKNDRNVIDMGYLKRNTLHPGDIISGYVNIKRKKGKELLVYVVAEGKVHEFVFSVEKQKKEKGNKK